MLAGESCGCSLDEGVVKSVFPVHSVLFWHQLTPFLCLVVFVSDKKRAILDQHKQAMITRAFSRSRPTSPSPDPPPPPPNNCLEVRRVE